MYLGAADYIALAAYAGGLVILGIATGHRQRSQETYFVGERRTSWLLAGISVLATLLSTLTFLSTPGEMIRYGIGYFSSLLAFVFIIPLVNWILIPFLMRLPVSSVYDCLERRYDVSVRTLGAGVFVLMRLVWIGLIFYTASFAAVEMTGWDMRLVVLAMAGVTTFYTTLGGLQAVIWSDLVQFLFGGAAFIPFYVALETGSTPADWCEVFSAAGRASVPLWSCNPDAAGLGRFFDPTVRISVVGIMLTTLVWNICTHGADQVAAQRYLSTPSAAAARRSVWVFSLLNVGTILLLMVCGLALFYFNYARSGLTPVEFQALIAPQADKVVPRFIVEELHYGMAGLMLAAILAAAMSSLSSGINSIAAVTVTDFFQRLGRRDGDQGDLRLARLASVLAGCLGAGLALGVHALMQSTRWNLVELIERVNHLLLAPLGALFLAGILIRRVGTAAAWLGFFAGAATSVLVSFAQEIFGLRSGISFMWIMPAALVVSVAVSYLSSFLFAPPTPDQLAAALGARRQP
jgi:SSS family solute:Na+ symporter